MSGRKDAKGSVNDQSGVMTGLPPTRESQVTFANYISRPYNRWAFRNMDVVTHTAMMPRGGPLPVMNVSGQAERYGDQSVSDIHGTKMPLRDLLKTYSADGFIVLKEDEILFEQYLNGYSEHQRHIWYSMTKSLVSTAFGILMDQYDIDLTASPAQYVEELKGSGFERTTIQQVLNHASAIAFKENYVDTESDFARFYAPAINLGYVPGARDVQPEETDIYGVYDFLARFIEAEPENIPGDSFEYNSANADLIGWIIARVSGMSVQEFIGEHIWRHIGSNHDAAIVVDRAYMAVATGGMTSTLRDAALFGRLILNRGFVNGKQCVPKAWIDETINLNDQDRLRYAANPLYVEEAWQYYKNMWWIIDPERGEYAAVGIHGQVIYINRAANTVIAQFSSQATASQVGSEDFRSKLSVMRQLTQST